MAWDTNSSPWDWDAEGVTVSSHGSEIDPHKAAVNIWPTDTELSPAKHNGAFTLTSSRALGPLGERTCAVSHESPADVARHGNMLTNRVVTPVMANAGATLAFVGKFSHSNIVPTGQGRLPIVTTCIGNGSFVGDCDHGGDNCGIGGLESMVQNGLPENQARCDMIKVEALEMGSQQQSFGQHKLCRGVTTKVKDHVIGIKHDANKFVQNSCNGDGIYAMDEQHSSTAMGSAGSGDSLTGLQLGKRTYSQDVTPAAAPKATPKPVITSKKGRAGAATSQIPRCQVEGCKLDLTSAKDYHRRHKVCEPHSKAGKVVVASLEQRFCQQCSRFHILTEFDESKRSCRRRLAGHNKRRRKPQPDPLELQARLRSTLEDWSYLHHPRMSFWQDGGDFRSNGLWPRRYENQPMYDYTLQTLGTEVYMKGLSPSMTRERFPLLLLQSPNTMMQTDPRFHQYIPGFLGGPVGSGLTLASSPSIRGGVYTGLETTPIVTDVTRVTDSGRALSLLSLQSQCSQAPDMVSLDLSGLANTTTLHYDHHVQDETLASQQFMLQGRHLHSHDLSETLSMASNMQLHSPADMNEGHVMASSEKDLFECPFVRDFNRQNGYETSHPMFASMQGDGTTGEVKQTRDLMQLSSFQMPSPRQSMVFHVESSALGDSQFSNETSFSKF